MPDYRRRATREAMSLRFDFSGCFAAEPTEQAVPRAAIEALASRLVTAHQQIQAREEAGELPVFSWLHSREGLAEVRELAEAVRQQFQTLVVVGTGGTALAVQALVRAQGARTRVVFADSIDPDCFGALIEQLDLSTTAFNVISKSGETPETLAQFLVVRDLLLRQLGAVDYAQHLVVTTDADQGALRQIVHDEGFRSLPIPPGVSDRLAAISPASLFPAAVSGMRIDDILAGAAWMESRCREPDVWRNPALLLAAVLYWASVERNVHTWVFVPFCHNLEALAQWSAELVGELFANGGANGRFQSSPLHACWIRSADPTLLAQVLLGSARDTFVVPLAVQDHGREWPVASAYQDLEPLAYLGGHGLADILAAGRRALETLLVHHRRWFVSAAWPQVSPFTLGQWVYGLQRTVFYLAELFGIQPGAEEAGDACRRLLYGALGRKGFEAQAMEVQRYVAERPSEWLL